MRHTVALTSLSPHPTHIRGVFESGRGQSGNGDPGNEREPRGPCAPTHASTHASSGRTGQHKARLQERIEPPASCGSQGQPSLEVPMTGERGKKQGESTSAQSHAPPNPSSRLRPWGAGCWPTPKTPQAMQQGVEQQTPIPAQTKTGLGPEACSTNKRGRHCGEMDAPQEGEERRAGFPAERVSMTRSLAKTNKTKPVTTTGGRGFEVVMWADGSNLRVPQRHTKGVVPSHSHTAALLVAVSEGRTDHNTHLVAVTATFICEVQCRRLRGAVSTTAPNQAGIGRSSLCPAAAKAQQTAFSHATHSSVMFRVSRGHTPSHSRRPACAAPDTNTCHKARPLPLLLLLLLLLPSRQMTTAHREPTTACGRRCTHTTQRQVTHISHTHTHTMRARTACHITHTHTHTRSRHGPLLLT